MGETTWATRDIVFKVAGRTTPPGGRDTGCGLFYCVMVPVRNGDSRRRRRFRCCWVSWHAAQNRHGVSTTALQSNQSNRVNPIIESFKMRWRAFWRVTRDEFAGRLSGSHSEGARKLVRKHRGKSGRGASRRVAWREITKSIGVFACFLLFGSFAGGTPAARLCIRRPPAFHVRKAVFLVFNDGPPSALQPPFCFLFALLCKSVLQALCVSAPLREFFPLAPLPHTWRPWRTLREGFLRPTSAMARQDAAPPEVARKLGNGQRGRSEAGRRPGAQLDVRLQKTLGFPLGFRFSEASRAGRPRPDGTAAVLPPASLPLSSRWGATGKSHLLGEQRGARLQKTLGFSLGFRFSEASRAGRPRSDCASAVLQRSSSSLGGLGGLGVRDSCAFLPRFIRHGAAGCRTSGSGAEVFQGAGRRGQVGGLLGAAGWMGGGRGVGGGWDGTNGTDGTGGRGGGRRGTGRVGFAGFVYVLARTRVRRGVEWRAKME